MITREQALSLRHGDDVHYVGQYDCKRTVGPRGGIRVTITHCRVTGQVKTWKRRPEAFYLPIKYGMYGYGSISDSNAQCWHLATECPLNESEV